MLPYRRLFKYRMGRYRGSYDISSKYRLIIRYSIYRSIAIPSSIDIERSQVSRYFDISSIEPALVRGSEIQKSEKAHRPMSDVLEMGVPAMWPP